MRMLLFAAFLAATSSIASAQNLQMSCSDDPKQEAISMKASPHGAKRIGKHRLQVTWAHGVKTFLEKAPYNMGEIGGVNWSYCGYNATFKLHLIDKNDGDHELDSGILLDDATGAELPAGITVAFSPDGLYYAVTQQPGGQDGETLVVYSRKSGATLWRGYAGFLKGKDGNVIAQFGNYRWNGKDQLLADATPIDDGSGKPAKPPTLVTLTRQSTGKWTWSPDLSK
jgi:hypothetical protein